MGAKVREIGIMQGRLSPPEEGRFQAFPRLTWRDEFPRARDLGLSYLEWIYDEHGGEFNPLLQAAGVRELLQLQSQYQIRIDAICADWLMEYPLIRCSTADQETREARLWKLLTQAARIHATRVVLPMVDNASMRNNSEMTAMLRVLQRALPFAEAAGVEIHLETDLPPRQYARFLSSFPHPLVRVNYDTGNSSGLGFAVEEEFTAYGERIGSIHIKDRARQADGSIASRPLGSGSADFGAFFSCLEQIGYRGGLTLQTARAEAGQEWSWIRQQMKFVRQFWD